MDLHLEGSPFKLNVLKWLLMIITLHDHQVLVKAPRLATWDFVNILNFLKEKSISWSPIFCILKPFFARHNGLKFLAIELTLMALFVVNFAAIENWFTLSSSVRQQPSPSLSDKDRWFIDCARSSIDLVWTSTPPLGKLFPTPLEKKPHKLRNTKRPSQEGKNYSMPSSKGHSELNHQSWGNHSWTQDCEKGSQTYTWEISCQDYCYRRIKRHWQDSFDRASW